MIFSTAHYIVCLFNIFYRFEELKESGITVLEGKRLTEALANLPDEGMETAATEAEIENLKRKKESLSSQKQNYIKQLNLLKYCEHHRYVYTGKVFMSFLFI